MSIKPARFLTFKCKQCSKPVQLKLQKVSACSHIQPYQGICKCGTVMYHATGDQQMVQDFLAAPETFDFGHHHHH